MGAKGARAVALDAAVTSACFVVGLVVPWLLVDLPWPLDTLAAPVVETAALIYLARRVLLRTRATVFGSFAQSLVCLVASHAASNVLAPTPTATPVNYAELVPGTECHWAVGFAVIVLLCAVVSALRARRLSRPQGRR